MVKSTSFSEDARTLKTLETTCIFKICACRSWHKPTKNYPVEAPLTSTLWPRRQWRHSFLPLVTDSMVFVSRAEFALAAPAHSDTESVWSEVHSRHTRAVKREPKGPSRSLPVQMPPEASRSLPERCEHPQALKAVAPNGHSKQSQKLPKTLVPEGPSTQ